MIVAYFMEPKCSAIKENILRRSHPLLIIKKKQNTKKNKVNIYLVN